MPPVELAARVSLLALALAACGGTVEGGDPDARADAADVLCGDGVVSGDELCDDGENRPFGGGCLPGCRAFDTSDELFAVPMHTIELTLPAADWEALRHEVKSRHAIFGTGLDCRMHPFDSPYTWYQAEVRFDGESLAAVGVRKKGHLGSQSTIQPALKLDFERFADGRRFHALGGLALGNNKQDRSLSRTCTSYQLMRAAGVPAPRCTHAHVTVNGEPQGVYTLHEEVDKDFLARHFRDDDGNLYEGTAADFRPEFVGGFEKETHRGEPSRADLEAVVAALALPDDQVLAALDELVNLDAFYRFWAAEVLVWHRDGYAGNANNFYVYADPGDRGRFHFLPWGMDSALNGNGTAGVPDSVMAYGVLAHRLYQLPASRARYHAMLDDLLAGAWDPAALMARVDAIGAAADPLLSLADQSARSSNAGLVKTVIAGRADAIARARASGDPTWGVGLRTLPCRIPAGTAQGTFSTRWGTIGSDPFTSGTATLELEIDGSAVTPTRHGSRAGATGFGRVQVFGETSNRRYTMTVPYPDPRWFDAFSVVGDYPLILPPLTVTIVESALPGNGVLRRFELGEGTWTFTAAGQATNAPVAGSFTGQLFLVP